jgi:hypothetical protein
MLGDAMRTDAIEAVGIDEGGSLWVKPATATFPYIYREAMEVHWDAERLCIYSPKPREWSYARWFKQIKDAAREQGVELALDQTTSYSRIEPSLQQALACDE